MKVLAYCRVSTDNQKEEGTINLQVDAIRDYCIKKNYSLVVNFKDDGVSGGLEDRPGLVEMLSFLESEEGKEVEAVIIWKLDRLARDLYIQEHLIKKLEALNVKLISTKEADLDSHDPMRKAFRQFMGVVSELEKSFITMRLSGGRMQKAKQGGFAGGCTALGYTSESKELKQQAQEAETIRTIFKLKKNNHFSINEIARHLNDQGYKTKRGGRWYASTVSYILSNPLYKGKYEYKEIKAERNDLRLIYA